MKIACLLFLAITLLLPAVIGVREAIKLSRRKFLRTIGTIRSARISSSEPLVSETESIPTFRPEVHFDFEVDEQLVEGNQISLSKIESTDKRDVEHRISKYSSGDSVVVFFDPDDFSSAFLNNPKKYVPMIVIGVIFSLLIYVGLSAAILTLF